VLFVLATPALAGPASAETPSWAVEPSSAEGPSGRSAFVHDASPGEVIDDVVGISNLSDEPQTFRVYGTDAFSTADGGFALLRRDQRPVDVGRWVDFGASTYTVPPRSRLDLPFKIRVPAAATPGDHAGGVVAAVLERGEQSAGQRVDVDRRVAVRLYLRVAGPLRPAISIDQIRVAYDAPLFGVTTAPVTITYRIRNTGNTRLAGTERASVAGPFGVGRRTARPQGLPELLPGATIIRTLRVSGVRPLVRLRAEVQVDLEPAGGVTGQAPATVERSTTWWAVPWAPTGAIAILAIFTWRRRRLARSHPKQVVQP
jgi:hypothetical protein